MPAVAPRLQALQYSYVENAPANRTLPALPADIGLLSRLTSLTLRMKGACVTSAQLGDVLQALPSLPRLTLT